MRRLSRHSPPRPPRRSQSAPGFPASKFSSRPATAGGEADGGSRSEGGSSHSDRDQLAVLTPGGTKPVADLAHGGIGADGVEDRRHQVSVAAGGRLESVHRRGP